MSFKESDQIIEVYKPPQIATPEIDKIKHRMSILIEEMKPDILDGRYNLLISDEKSGRVPALVMREIVNHVNFQNGMEPARLVLFNKVREQDEGEVNNEKTKEKFRRTIQRSVEAPGNALFITEHLGHGRAIELVRDVLQDFDIKMGVFSLASRFNRSYYEALLSGEKAYSPKLGHVNYGFRDQHWLLSYPQSITTKKDIKALSEILIARHFQNSV